MPAFILEEIKLDPKGELEGSLIIYICNGDAHDFDEHDSIQDSKDFIVYHKVTENLL